MTLVTCYCSGFEDRLRSSRQVVQMLAWFYS